MLALDTNILLYAYSAAAPEHPAAHAFINALSSRDDVALSEFSLAEFYLHLRNPAVVAIPLTAPAATAVIQAYRHHPRWRILGYPPDSLAAHEALWQHSAAPQFARRRLFDTRTALTLRHHGVTEFATANVKDFEGFGFTRVWNPLA
ncbi:MAG: ribonuclease VapC24 [Verrucomicrobiota bacterium]|jgi:toxin-antitoxin system PIN domain toxin